MYHQVTFQLYTEQTFKFKNPTISSVTQDGTDQSDHLGANITCRLAARGWMHVSVHVH